MENRSHDQESAALDTRRGQRLARVRFRRSPGFLRLDASPLARGIHTASLFQSSIADPPLRANHLGDLRVRGVDRPGELLAFRQAALSLLVRELDPAHPRFGTVRETIGRCRVQRDECAGGRSHHRARLLLGSVSSIRDAGREAGDGWYEPGRPSGVITPRPRVACLARGEWRDAPLFGLPSRIPEPEVPRGCYNSRRTVSPPKQAGTGFGTGGAARTTSESR